MMTPRLPRRQLAASLACVAAGMLIGWLAGWGRGDGDSDGSNKGGPAAAGAERRHQAANGGDAGARRDFASYLRRVERQTTSKEAEEAVARLSRAELQALLAAAPEPGQRGFSSREDYLMTKVRASAAAELVRREGAAAIDWAQAGSHRGAWAALLQALAEVDPAAAKQGEAAYYGGSMLRSGPRLDYVAMQGAAARSAKDVIECLKLGYDPSFEYIPAYAPGFDFAAVVATINSSGQPERFGDSVKYLVGSWAAANPEAAAAAMMKGMQDPSRDWTATFGPALAGRAAMAGEDAAGKWMAGILKEVPEERHYQVLQTLIDRDLTTARANGLIAQLEDRDRIELAFISVDQYGLMYDNRQTLLLINAMPTADLQMQALQEIAKRTIRERPAEPSRQRHKQLESLMAKLQLSEAAMQKVFESAGE